MDKISFTVNGDRYSLSGSDVSPVTTLNDYLRDYLQLFGTKAMCHEGGCGACVVTVTRDHHTFSVNSCLVHILSCHEWEITTVEGLAVGSPDTAHRYHPLQTQLANFNGTQCGYCTPGWIMSMYSLYEGANKKLTLEQIESSFGGNMCRCTGYRPILDAFKTFAVDAPPDSLLDVEDLSKLQCMNDKRRCSVVDEEWCVVQHQQKDGDLMEVAINKGRWYKAYKVQDVFKILAKEGTDSYTLVAGNTAKGVYHPPEVRVYIDISSVGSLKETLHEGNLVFGAGMSITDVMAQCHHWATTNEDFKYLDQFYKHLDLVAHVPVRNVGTIGGNLAMKNLHPDFPSDIFLLLATIGATVTILNSSMEKREVSVEQFMSVDLSGQLVLDVKLPPLGHTHYVTTYKIMPRSQNAHAIVNAGFHFKVDSEDKVVDACIVYGAITPDFVRATATENALKGLKLSSTDTLHKALAALSDEVSPSDLPPEPAPSCRKMLALNLLYRAILSHGSTMVSPRYRSGAAVLHRGISRGTQTFDTDKTLWPLNQPVNKLEALAQCSGSAQFVCETAAALAPRSAHAAFVLSAVCTGHIDRIDAAEALKIPGVLAFYTAKDIPGKNTFTPLDVPWQDSEEEILASKSISYYGQPIGLIAAVTRKLAIQAAAKVKVTYTQSNETPVLTIQDAMQAADKDRRFRSEATITPSAKGTDIQHVIKGNYSMGSQYHYTMETQSCHVSTTARGLHVRSSTQWMDLVQVAVAQMLAIPENRVTVSVPRVGGGYGGKASRSALVACGAALVAAKLGRGTQLVMSLQHNMHAVGKRQPCYADYEVGVNSSGVIQYLNLTYYSDCGHSFNDSSAPGIASTLTNLYASDTWSVRGYSVLTDTASHTWCRAPSTTEATAIIEHIMERIAFTTKQDPIEVRQANLDPKHSAMREIIASFKRDCSYDERLLEIERYNEANAWKKKALSMCLMSYPIEYSGGFPVTLSVYHADGSVEISHGGIEMGQGINTKVAQVCAYTLKVPLDKVSVRSSDSFTSPNALVSSGSITSECVAFAAVRAAELLLQRLDLVKRDMDNPTWEELVKRAFQKEVNLQSSYMMSSADNLQQYSVYGAGATEVELDVMSGNYILRRQDIVEDTGLSLSPNIDVGQIEGAFVMGVGLWTCEQLKYCRSTGRLLTDNTWTYKVCGARDIPEDFRVAFRRNSVNTAGVLRSKATGEPALVLAVGVTHALHKAIMEARREYGYTDTEWLSVDTPYCVENMLKAIAPRTEAYRLN